MQWACLQFGLWPHHGTCWAVPHLWQMNTRSLALASDWPSGEPDLLRGRLSLPLTWGVGLPAGACRTRLETPPEALRGAREVIGPGAPSRMPSDSGESGCQPPCVEAMRRGEGQRMARPCRRGRPTGPGAASRTVTDGSAQPGPPATARPLAFRPGALISTLHSARHVKSTRPGAGAGLAPGLKPRVDTCQCPHGQERTACGEGRPPGGYRKAGTVARGARARATVVPAASRRPGTGAAPLGQRVILVKGSGMAGLIPRAAAPLIHLHKSGFECLFSLAAREMR